MTLAAAARDAVRANPFLLEALRADVVNYTAAARYVDVAGDEEAVATALRRFAEDLPKRDPADRGARVTMESGLGTVDDTGEAVLAVGDVSLARGRGDRTGILATGDVDAAALAWILARLLAVDVSVDAAGVAGEALTVVVPRRDGPRALHVVEDALAGVPERRSDE